MNPMEVTKGTLYAVYTLIYFHRRPYGDVADLHTLSQLLEAPESYLSKVLQQLHKAGYLASHMGSKGGYRLAKHVEKSTMREIMNVMQGESLMQECLLDDYNCDRFKKCAVLHHVRDIQRTVNEMLEKLTIEQLAAEMEFKERQQKGFNQTNIGVQ
jgi:Rrf2 family protein